MSDFATEFDFVLPKGYVDAAGTVHREGSMRLATAADEILPQKDPRVQGNPAYLVLILLARVVVRLGALDAINPKVIEGMFAADLAYLQDFYNRINSSASLSVAVACPSCQHTFEVEPEKVGE
ncbi:phage tail assembly protein [Undibacterium sp. Ji50W]|uniref:phage tail assembly protein n=1 Tax=Undibacterium sp. Ji50W TaxID=3413041 RepID=UPI003BF23FBE